MISVGVRGARAIATCSGSGEPVLGPVPAPISDQGEGVVYITAMRSLSRYTNLAGPSE